VRQQHVVHLRCAACRGCLDLSRVTRRDGDRVEEGLLACRSCAARTPIVRYVPRFVDSENYAAGFGLQWNLHARTQLDSATGLSVTRDRFFSQTKWPIRLDGQLVLEVGGGAGRFTEQAASTGATVVSLDYSSAVDANYRNNGMRENVLIVQGDLYQMPFPTEYFDRVFCLGVLQHTPDPASSFAALVDAVKPGGSLAVDVYARTFAAYWLHARYWVRPLVRAIPNAQLYSLVRRYVDVMWPVVCALRQVPPIGASLAHRLLMISDFSGFGLPPDRVKEWAYLDTYDMLAPRYDLPQSVETVRSWFEKARFGDVEVHRGYNGVEGRGVRSHG